MLLAISEARKGIGSVEPNPPVGCVILDKKFRLLSKGYHKKYGGHHAEIDALNNLQKKFKGRFEEKLKGAHLFVTLEPCSHYGKTPPCAETLAKLPLATITYGLVDPNPQVSGRGKKYLLRHSHIKVQKYAGDNSELKELIETFSCNIQSQRPFVLLKIASSLDGQMALKNGQSQWITGEKSREFVHLLRSQTSAVLIGRGTFEADNPRLDSRLGHFKKRQNKVIVLDPDGKTLRKINKSALASVRDAKNIIVITSDKVKSHKPTFKHLVCPLKDGDFAIEELLNLLYKEGIYSVMVEGGAKTFSYFLRHQLVDRLLVFQAPVVIGAGYGKPWTEKLVIKSLSKKLRLKYDAVYSVGDDFVISAKII